MADAEVIDRATLNNLLVTVGDDMDFFDDLMSTFFDDAPKLLGDMRRATETGQAEELRRAAHSLKSNSANFGATALTGMCKELEELGKGGVTDVDDRLAKAETEYHRVRDALQTLRASGL
ncbi:MAG: Hpt domain-containing protein [Chloroflexi bacterium]|nr:Hpt domain-containing protein [Chloroflexota bacterium]